jgi:hypothetical protein
MTAIISRRHPGNLVEPVLLYDPEVTYVESIVLTTRLRTRIVFIIDDMLLGLRRHTKRQ